MYWHVQRNQHVCFASSFPSGMQRGRNPPSHLVSLPGSRQSWHLHRDGPTLCSGCTWCSFWPWCFPWRISVPSHPLVGGTSTQPCNVCSERSGFKHNGRCGNYVSLGPQMTSYHSAKKIIHNLFLFFFPLKYFLKLLWMKWGQYYQLQWKEEKYCCTPLCVCLSIPPPHLSEFTEANGNQKQ